MSIRKINKLENERIGAPTYVTKQVGINRKIPFCYDLNDLEAIKPQLNDKEYLSLYQQFKEIELYENTEWSSRDILAPIVDVYYDKYNCPVLIFPYFTPLATEEEARLIDDDAMVDELLKKASLFGYDEYQIGIILEKLTDFCYVNDMREKEMLLNLNNLGYNEHFGIRAINYGTSNKVYNEIKNKYLGDNNEDL